MFQLVHGHLFYEDNSAFQELFAALNEAEEKLSTQRFVAGNYFTESDVRLFASLIRFDSVYYVHFKCNLKRIIDYPNLSNWLRDVYQIPGMSSTVLMKQIKDVSTLKADILFALT